MSNVKSILRIPPQNLDAEKAVLGSVMLRPGALFEVSDILSAESFYAEKHKIIYNTMVELSLKNEPIDFLSLSTRLKEKKLLDSIGGSSYLTELANLVPSSSNIKHYAQSVQKKYILRSLIEAADHISELGMKDGEDDIEEVLDQAEKRILGVSSPKTQNFVAIKDILPEIFEQINNLHESKDNLRGVPSGFPALDQKLSGFQKSDLIILAARPSVGKTTLALDIARLAATKHGIPVGIFSLEMSTNQLISRMFSAESRVDAWKLRTGKNLLDKEFSLLSDALDRLAKAPIFINDQSDNSIVKIRSMARRMKSEHHVQLIIIDYLQLMTTSKNYESAVREVTEISRSLKGLARELNVPVLALSQLSRAVESRGGRPRLSDLRDSGSIEQDADVVMFIHREDKENSVAEILIEKHRNGPTGIVELSFDKEKTTFLPMDNGSLDDFVASSSNSNSLDNF